MATDPRWARALLRLIVLLPSAGGAFAGSQPSAQHSPNLRLTDPVNILDLLRLPDGSIVVAGQMTLANDQPRAGLARLLPDGGLHPWAPTIDQGGGSSAWALWLDASGRLYVGGSFIGINGQPRASLARFNADGSLDPGFTPAVDGNVSAFAEGLAGEICIGGNFSEVNGVARANLACLSMADGSLNMAWNPGTNNWVHALARVGADLYVGGQFTEAGGVLRFGAARVALAGAGAVDAWHPSLSGGVHAIVASGDAVYLGGWFQAVGGIEQAVIAKVTASTGSLVPGWDGQGTYGNRVRAMVSDGAGGVVAAGDFVALGGQPRRGIARLDGATGNAVAGWNPGIDYGEGWALIQDGANYLVGGPFSSVGNVPGISVARVLANGTADAGFVPAIEERGLASRVVRHPINGELVVAGRFARVNGLVRRHLFRLNHPSAVDPDWAPSLDREPRAVAFDSSGRLYVGGEFGNVNGQARQYLVRLADDATGSVDGGWSSQPDRRVTEVLVRDEGIYVAGDFLNIDGSARSYLARLAMADGALDPTWAPQVQATPTLRVVDALESFGDQLLIGGRFTGIDGSPRGGLAKLGTGASAVLDPDWTPQVAGSVYALAVVGDDVYVGGDFSAVNGVTFPGGIARVAASGAGAVDLAWMPSSSLDAETILPMPEGIYLGGVGLMRVSAVDGAPDSTWAPLVGGTVTGMVRDRKSVIAVGQFFVFGGQPRVGIGRLPVAGDTILLDHFDG